MGSIKRGEQGWWKREFQRAYLRPRSLLDPDFWRLPKHKVWLGIARLP